MLNVQDFSELEKIVEKLMETEKRVGQALEQKCSEEFWQETLGEAVKARREFYTKLYAMRLALIG